MKPPEFRRPFGMIGLGGLIPALKLKCWAVVRCPAGTVRRPSKEQHSSHCIDSTSDAQLLGTNEICLWRKTKSKLVFWPEGDWGRQPPVLTIGHFVNCICRVADVAVAF